MPSIDWSNLILLQEWAEALRTILAAAEAAVQEPGGGARQEAAELLHTFVKKSPVNAGALDAIASRAIIDLNISVIADALRAIQSRSAELKQQLDLISGVTNQAKMNAKKLRFDAANKVLADAKTALKALEEANNALGTPDAALTRKISAIIKAMDELG